MRISIFGHRKAGGPHPQFTVHKNNVLMRIFVHNDTGLSLLYTTYSFLPSIARMIQI
jgi:hypothetical protein